ncbi:MAG: sensor histidine kinase [Propioniciclava sp.]
MSETTPEPGWRIPAWLGDALAALVVVSFASGGGFFLRPLLDQPLFIVWVVLALIPAPLMFLRRRYPRIVLALVVVCFVAGSLVSGSDIGPAVAVAFALYSAVVSSRRSTGWWIAAATAVVLLIVNLVVSSEYAPPAILQVLLIVGATTALGDAVRSRRQYTEELKLRAERAEQTREAEASRAVAEDRLRIARDLHDAVAHQISVISLNAGVASATLEADPSAARDALGTIRSASRTVLTDIGDLLSTLRAPEEERRAPTVGTSSLDALLAEFTEVGLHTTFRIDGDLSSLSTAVDVVVYRVAQEGLTNALKHGTEPRTHLWIAVDDAEVRVVITNPAGSTEPGTHGHGLTGIRERVESVRGTVNVAMRGDTHRLEATIPQRGDEA